MTALDRIKAAVAGTEKGLRGPDGGQRLVEVRADDLAEVTGGLDTDLARVLHAGATHKGAKGGVVAVQADALYHVIENAEGKPSGEKPAGPEPAPPAERG